MAGKVNNCFLINAPAGSGKTTSIKALMQKCLVDNPKDNILCITYTNRAAEELSSSITSKNVFIGTIHAFLHSFMKIYFAHSSVLELYFEMYGEQIKERISNADCKDNIAASNSRYREKYGELDYDTVKKNIRTISYNESSFSSYYYGGLSHDDLICFSKAIIDRYPIISKRITSKYQFIFIDEYQDTMSDVLNFFYRSVTKSASKLYLFGDRMQQIYKNYDGSFESQFEVFDTTLSLTTNYRSTNSIVSILNNIYNDPSLIQRASNVMENVKADFLPRIIICFDIPAFIDKLRLNNPDTLVLYLFNKERFSDIDAINLYKAFDGMKKYSFGMAYSAADVLTKPYEDNPDALLKLLFCIAELAILYKTQQYGKIIQTLKINKSIFSKESWFIQTHNDKQRVFENIKSILSMFDNKDRLISDMLDNLVKSHLLNERFINDILDDEDNILAFSVPVVEIIHVYDYLKDPKVSTQHGVKGESHDSVAFVAEDSSRSPFVAMYQFFEMWSKIPVSLNSLNQFYYEYLNELTELQHAIGMKVSELKKETYEEHEILIHDKIHAIDEKLKGNPYYEFIYKNSFNQYVEKPGVTKAKSFLRVNNVYSILSAYRLFYVGCSRARRNLTILLDHSKIRGNVLLQKKRFEQIGFEVIELAEHD